MIITLCGSSKFKAAWYHYAAAIEHAGHSVFAMHTFHHADGIDYHEHEKVLLDLGHLHKIVESDAIFVVDHPDPDNPQEGLYIGASTRREIEWALLNGKQVFCASKPADVQHLVTSPMEHEVRGTYMPNELPPHITGKQLEFN